ncbi:MAG: putative transcriptional regulator [Idiomarinaceae bacterium HL-53]|nr:MAG: putative transcriptional regulator [Idiomarinaceae bacterium HL-53]CUS48277.1 putative transcriptional regulator [Idiomarinaceae bacterium HL-53]
MSDATTSFQNHFLIAMPGLDDPFFHRSVTYVCEHNDDGAMGLIVNQPVELTLDKLLEQIEIEVPKGGRLDSKHVYAGGPVATDRGFVIHSPQKGWKSSLQLSDDIMVTTSKDILAAFGSEQAPAHYLLMLGYAGWEAGQLEQEIADNSWLTIPADSDLLFKTPSNERWEKATSKLGIDIWQLSSQAGHA